MSYKVIALNTIHLAASVGKAGHKLAGIAPVAPEIREIKPGEVFIVEKKSDYEFFLRTQSIRDWSEEDAEAIRRLTHVIGEYDGHAINEDERAELEALREQAKARALEGVRGGADVVQTRPVDPSNPGKGEFISDTEADKARAAEESRRSAEVQAQADADAKAKADAEAADAKAAEKAKAKEDAKNKGASSAI